VSLAHGDLRQIVILLRLSQAHRVPSSRVYAELRIVWSHTHAKAVRSTAATVDDVLRSVLTVHGRVTSGVLTAGSEGRGSLRHDLAPASSRSSARHPLLVLSCLGHHVVLDTNLRLVGNGVNSLLRMLRYHSVRRVHMEGPLGGWPGHVLGWGGSSLLVGMMEPGLLAWLLVWVAPRPTTGVRVVRVGHGKVWW